MITLKQISERKIVDMGQCMCPVNCVKKLVEDKKLTKTVLQAYTNQTTTLKQISERKIVDMGQCMCPVNCVKKSVEDKNLTAEVSQVYQKTLKKIA